MGSSNERVTYSGLGMCTDRLRIETLACHHAQQVFELLQDRRIYKYIPEAPPPSVEALEVRYRQLVAGPGPDAGQRWLNWIVFLRQSAFPIGSLQATVATSRAEIAYIVYPEYWGNGFAKEGVIWLLNYLSTEAGVTEALANIDARNAASIAVVRSVGFKKKNLVSTEEGHDIAFVKHLQMSVGTRRNVLGFHGC